MTLRPFTSTPLVLFKSSTMSSRALLKIMAWLRLTDCESICSSHPGARPMRVRRPSVKVSAARNRCARAPPRSPPMPLGRRGGCAAEPLDARLQPPEHVGVVARAALEPADRQIALLELAARALETRAQRAVLLGQLLQAHDLLRELIAHAFEVRLHALDRPPRLVEVRHEHGHLLLMGLAPRSPAPRFAPQGWRPPPPRRRPHPWRAVSPPPVCERSSATSFARAASSASTRLRSAFASAIWLRSSARERSISCVSCAFLAKAARLAHLRRAQFLEGLVLLGDLGVQRRSHELQTIAFRLQRPAPALFHRDFVVPLAEHVLVEAAAPFTRTQDLEVGFRLQLGGGQLASIGFELGLRARDPLRRARRPLGGSPPSRARVPRPVPWPP